MITELRHPRDALELTDYAERYLVDSFAVHANGILNTTGLVNFGLTLPAGQAGDDVLAWTAPVPGLHLRAISSYGSVN